MSPKPYVPPTGRISAKKRPFEEIVRDLRHVVFSVVRHRDLGNGQVEVTSLGSGFFVSSSVFMTCHHVVASAKSPHKDGDSYQLVSNLTGDSVAFYVIRTAQFGKDLHLFPECDLALLISNARKDQPFVSLEYGNLPVGREIGVAGYPLPRLSVENSQLQYAGLIFRVAKGVVTAIYSSNIQSNQGAILPNVPVIEVNFLFVPGNSGGPVFDAETGRVAGFVHGYTTTKIREKVEEVSIIDELPAGMSRNYIESLSALYSLAIRLETARPHLEQFGVTL